MVQSLTTEAAFLLEQKVGYIMQLHKLSNQELETQLHSYVKQERKLLHIILMHIREVDARKLYLKKARSSLFEYLTKDLEYSSSAAQRRIEAMRLLKEIPALTEQIQSGAVNLSQLGILSQAIKQKEKESTIKVSCAEKQSLLCKIASQSTFQTQVIISQALDLELKPLERKIMQKDESVHLQITLSKSQNEKLMQCKNLAVHKLVQEKKGLDLCDVIELLADQYLKSKLEPNAQSVKNRADINIIESRTDSVKDVDNAITAEAVIQSIIAEKIRSNFATSEFESGSDASIKIRKCISPKIRRELLHKLKCCQYQNSENGEICGSEFALEVEHLQPLWAAGDHRSENLTVLCASHNKYKYRRQAHFVI